MFCLDEPDRHPSFTAANDRTLAFAERSRGRLIPFVRLDLKRVADRGGPPLPGRRRSWIKLHPRAQKFTATDERTGTRFEIAAERRVPILIHGGRGLPPIAAGLRALVERYPESAADHRARRHRRPRRARQLHGRAQGRVLRHVDLEPDRPARLLTGAYRPSRSCMRATIRTASSRRRS